jgi:hypothetical protein
MTLQCLWHCLMTGTCLLDFDSGSGSDSDSDPDPDSDSLIGLQSEQLVAKYFSDTFWTVTSGDGVNSIVREVLARFLHPLILIGVPTHNLPPDASQALERFITVGVLKGAGMPRCCCAAIHARTCSYLQYLVPYTETLASHHGICNKLLTHLQATDTARCSIERIVQPNALLAWLAVPLLLQTQHSLWQRLVQWLTAHSQSVSPRSRRSAGAATSLRALV